MKKFVSDLWEVLCERCRIHRALRILSKQEWSVEFLTALLIRASHVSKQQLEMSISGPNGVHFTVRTTDTNTSKTLRDDSIFDHLDDERKIQEYMRTLSNG
jgi:hypothetical protein